MGNVIFIHHIHNINIGLTEETTLNKSSTSTASNLSSGRSHSRKNSKPKRSLPFATPELVKKKPHLDEVIPKVNRYHLSEILNMVLYLMNKCPSKQLLIYSDFLIPKI